MIDVLVLDVNETLTDLESLRDGFVTAGLPAHSLDAWFAATLRDGFALTAAGAYADFRVVGGDVLASQLAAAGIDPTEETINGVLSGFTRLPLHPDVEPGLRRLHESGVDQRIGGDVRARLHRGRDHAVARTPTRRRRTPTLEAPPGRLPVRR